MDKKTLAFYCNEMNEIIFSKYNATGNDFIIIDNRELVYRADDRSLWNRLYTLKTGIGADGVLLLEQSEKADFKMRYINADGGEVEMCGNGARAITAYAHKILNKTSSTYFFETMNGIYECSLDKENSYKLKMSELYDVEKLSLKDLEPELQSTQSMYLNTGVPHAVFEVTNLKDYPLYENGKKVRFDHRFPKGANANFYEVLNKRHIKIRTYERGVENETLSCGTGATATALAAAKAHGWSEEIILETLGGRLIVKFNESLSQIYLCGKVEKIFDGKTC